MSRMKSPQASGSYRLLLHVPKRAIIDRLLQSPIDKQAAEAAYRASGGRSVAVDRKQLAQLSQQKLIEIFVKCTSTCDGDACLIHDAWRYRGMKSLFLYRLGGIMPAESGLIGRLDAAVRRRMLPTADGPPTATDSRFRFGRVDSFDAARHVVLELSYHYVSDIDYIDPEDEEPKSVGDLHSGFSWLCPGGEWAAIAAPDTDTRDLIVECLQPECAGTLAQLRFSKDVIDVIEEASRRRRVALIDPQTKTTRRYTGQYLGKDILAQDEIRLRLTQDDAPFSGFDVSVDRNTSMVLGYNNRQGKIFFSKDLTAEQLRAWGPAKVVEIRNAVDLTLRKVPRYRKNIIAAHLEPIAAPMRDAATMLVEAVAACKAGGVSEHLLQHRGSYFRRHLGNLVTTTLYAVRDDTEEVASLACSDCLSERLSLSADGKQVECRDCSHVMHPSKLGVTSGAPLKLSSIDEALQIVPAPRLVDCVLKAAAEITGKPANLEEEFFFLRADVLFYRRLSGNVVLTVDDIPELGALLDGPITGRREVSIRTALPIFKEKCQKIGTSNCASCVANPHGKKCYLRLYGLLDPTFTPQPHGSMEYGDYAKRVTLDGRPDRYCVVLMKSAPKNQRAITSSSKEGREILEQAFKYMQDAGAAAIGVSVPRILHDNLRKMLVQLARWQGKKLLFIDEPVLTRIISTIMRRKGIKLADF